MAVPEARRHDLYHGLEEVLGTERAETLMAYLPWQEAVELATTADVSDVRREVHDLRGDFGDLRGEFKDLRGEFKDLRTEFKDLRTEVKVEIQDLRTEMNERFQSVDAEIRGVNRRLDTLFLTLLAGLVATVGTVAVALFAG